MDGNEAFYQAWLEVMERDEQDQDELDRMEEQAYEAKYEDGDEW
ncbi:hypothetical protein [Agrilactobacillus fermenti]|nr:hypothetical protein [Agrilactobacillus fermenti]